MNSVQKSLALARICTRQYSSPSTQFHSLKKKQAKFGVDDGVPVFLKGGITDKLMYQATIVLMLTGTGMMLKLFWDLAVPKKN